MSFKISKFGLCHAIYIDIDGTLVKNGVLNKDLCKWIKHKKDKKWQIILWSARGKQYADSILHDYGLRDLFDCALSKPGIIVDDQNLKWLKFTVVIDTF